MTHGNLYTESEIKVYSIEPDRKLVNRKNASVVILIAGYVIGLKREEKMCRASKVEPSLQFDQTVCRRNSSEQWPILMIMTNLRS